MCALIDHGSKALFVSLSVVLAGLAGAGCASGDPLSGTWAQPDATTDLPPSLPGPLNVNATFVFDGSASPGTFDMKLGLADAGLADSIDAHGTYQDDGTNLTLTFTGFTIDPASGNMAQPSEDGSSQCITLHGFADSPVCFPTVQTNPYTLSGNTLSMTVEQSIIGAPVSQTHFDLTGAS